MSVGKLVRDNIPAIITNNGRKPTIRTLDENEYLVELEKKLQEEVNEYLVDKNGEELADILEVIYALGRTLNLSPEELEDLRKMKASKNGAFENKTYLVSIED